nr:HAMP domain-containing sensor histidine kinase [Thalassovita mangrovi]
MASVKRLRDQVSSNIAELDRDAALLADFPAVYGVMRAQLNNGTDPLDQSTEAQWRARLNRSFHGVLRANPKYVRVEFITLGPAPEHIVDISLRPRGAEDPGPAGRPVPWLDLGAAAGGAVRGDLHSGLLLREQDTGASAEQLSLIQAARIVQSPTGAPFAVILLSLDFSWAFAQFAGTMPDQQDSFLVDLDRGAGIRSGDGVTIVGDLSTVAGDPELQTLFGAGARFHGIVGQPGQASIAYLTELDPGAAAAGRGMMIGSLVPAEKVLADLPGLRKDLIALAAFLALAGGAVIFAMSNIILGRLRSLSRATRVLSSGGNAATLRLPAASGDEIGRLSAHFRDMVAAIGQREETLRDSEARMRSIVEAAGSAILSTDAAGRIESANPAAGILFGAGEDGLVGRTLADLLDLPRVGDSGVSVLEAIGAGHSAADILPEGGISARRLDGGAFPAHLSLGRVSLRDRMVFTAIITDLTETKRMERMKSEFVSTVSHELRTPLTSIKGSLGVLLADALAGEVSDKARSLIRIASRNSDRLIRLINDILDIEKIEAGKLVFDFEPVNVAAKIDQVLKEISGFAVDSGVTVAADDIADDIWVEADRDRLSQVLTNLVANAVKFSPEGGTVTLAAAPAAGGRVRISVLDNGPGIDAAFQGRIFDKFSQADSSDARQKGGTGLGLAIAKSIVDAHGGCIGFDTEPGAGTCFWFELPRRRSAAPQSPGAAPKVLIRRDGTGLRQVLGELGFETLLCPSEAEIRARLRWADQAELFLNLDMPGLDLTALIAELRDRAGAPDAAAAGAAITAAQWLQTQSGAQGLRDTLLRAVSDREPGALRLLYVAGEGTDGAAAAEAVGGEMAVDMALGCAAARTMLANNAYDLAALDLTLRDHAAASASAAAEARQPLPPILIYSILDRGSYPARHLSGALVRLAGDGAGADNGERTHHGT